MDIRIGQGFDVHKFAEGRELWLCGVKLEHERGLLGHSDADVALHALCDAILGALALGDIGKHFPDTDPAYKGIDSKKLLGHVCALASDKGWELGNADITVMAEEPKLKPHIDKMRATIAEVIGTDSGRISVKATTTEKLGFTGRREGIAAMAVVLMTKRLSKGDR